MTSVLGELKKEFKNEFFAFNYNCFEGEDLEYEDHLLDTFDLSTIVRNDIDFIKNIHNLNITSNKNIGETLFNIFFDNLYLKLKIESFFNGNKVKKCNENIYIYDNQDNLLKHYTNFDFYVCNFDKSSPLKIQDYRMKYLTNIDDLQEIINNLFLCKFNLQQMHQMELGINADVDISMYAKLQFNAKQMEQIREGLEEGIDVSKYTNNYFNADQMKEIKQGLISGVDVSKYDDFRFNSLQMKFIRKGLEDKLDVNRYANFEFNSGQMMEILEGLKERLNVSWYAKPEFNVNQMQQIREGLENDLDIEEYADPNIFAEEMFYIKEELLQQQEEMSL